MPLCTFLNPQRSALRLFECFINLTLLFVISIPLNSYFLILPIDFHCRRWGFNFHRCP